MIFQIPTVSNCFVTSVFRRGNTLNTKSTNGCLEQKIIWVKQDGGQGEISLQDISQIAIRKARHTAAFSAMHPGVQSSYACLKGIVNWVIALWHFIGNMTL